MSKLSEEYLGETEPSMEASPPVKVVQTSPWSSGVEKTPSHKDAVAWRKASEAYTEGIDPSDNAYGKLPIRYAKDYHFYVFGIHQGE